MKHFETVIDNLTKLYQDPNTEYSSTSMFPTANDLSFAISRLKDARKTFLKDSIAYKTFTSELWEIWMSLRDDIPSETASNLAFCMIQNTPLSKTKEQMKEVEEMFYKTLHTYTNNETLTQAFTEFFFNNLETKMPDTRDWE
jgi:hypothetical protein